MGKKYAATSRGAGHQNRTEIPPLACAKRRAKVIGARLLCASGQTYVLLLPGGGPDSVNVLRAPTQMECYLYLVLVVMIVVRLGHWREQEPVTKKCDALCRNTEH